jgi:hypothetical protein
MTGLAFSNWITVSKGVLHSYIQLQGGTAGEFLTNLYLLIDLCYTCPELIHQGQKEISTGGGEYGGRRRVFFCSLSIGPKLDTSQWGNQEVRNLVSIANLRLGPWNYKRIPWKNPGGKGTGVMDMGRLLLTSR